MSKTDTELREIVAQQAERIDELEAKLDELTGGEVADQESEGVSRRSALAALAALAGLGAGGGGLLASTQRAQAATANGFTKTGELRDGNGNTLATLNNGGPFEFQVPIQTGILKPDSIEFPGDNSNKGATVTRFIDKNGSSPGWATALQFNHDGGDNRFIGLEITYLVDNIAGGNKVDESARFTDADNDNNWGSTGSTTSITNHTRLKVDDNDNTIAFLQVNIDDNFYGGFYTATGVVAGGSTSIDPTGEL